MHKKNDIKTRKIQLAIARSLPLIIYNSPNLNYHLRLGELKTWQRDTIIDTNKPHNIQPHTQMNEDANSIQERVNSRIASTQQNEERRVVGVLRLLSMGALFFLIAIGIKSHISGHHFHGNILFLFALITFTNFINFQLRGNVRFFQNAFIFMVGILFLYLTASGGESNTGPLWFYVFPPIGFYVMGLKRGLMLSVGTIIAVFFIFYFPELPLVTTEYNPDFKIRFLSTLSFVAACAYVLDESRRKARDELIAMASLYERVARTDELTTLSNRRDMKECMEKELYRHQRSNSYFSIILMDIDHFKRVNDTYGHDAGDAVLKEFSSLLKYLSRKVDVVSRWGGEEFLMLLPDTSLVQALAMAERLRTNVESHSFTHKFKSIPITMSAGVCSVNQHEDIDSVLKHADVNLYEAKQKGRNRIEPPVKKIVNSNANTGATT